MSEFVILALMASLSLAGLGIWRYRQHHDPGAYLLAVLASLAALVLLLFVTHPLAFLLLLLALVTGALLKYPPLRRLAWRRQALWGCGGVAMALALGNLAYHTPGCSMDRVARQRIQLERQYQEVMMETLGAYLAREFPGSRILLITSEHARFASDRERALLRGLGRDARGVRREVLAPPPGNREAMPMLTAALLDKLVERHPGCQMVVCLVHLPADSARLRYWQRPAEQRPRTVALLEHPGAYGPHLLDGRLSVAVAPKPGGGFSYDKPLPLDRQQAFDQRYQILDHRHLAKAAKVAAPPRP